MTENMKPSLAQYLRLLRQAKNVTQEVAAVGMGINSATLRKLETFVSMPAVPVLERIAQYYGMTIAQLLERINIETSFREPGEPRDRLPPQPRYQGGGK